MKQLLSLFLTFCILLSAFCTFSPAFAADGDITYLYYDTDSKAWQTGTKASGEYTVASSRNAVTTWSSGWYYVDGEVTISSCLKINGNVNLILADNSVFTVNLGIRVTSGNSLTVYDQSTGGNMGILKSYGNDGYAGIGGENGYAGGTIIIHGGNITANGGNNAAGIGGGNRGANGSVTIYGGTVTANGGNNAAGIGAGYNGSSGGSFSTGTDGKAVVFASSISDSDSTDWTGIVFVGTSGKVYGTSVSPSQSFEIPSGYTLTISSGQTVTIPKGNRLLNNGTIVIEKGGSLIINGSIADNGEITINGTFTGNTTGGCAEHSYEDNGICQYCGDYEPAKLIADEASEHNGYYQIENLGKFLWFAEFVNSGNKDVNAVLTANIDMTDITGYTPIGQTASYHESNATATDTGYAGVFDGNGFIVKNLSITGGSGSDILSYGIFGTVSGTVKKLGADNFTFNVGSADCRAGSIAGQVLEGGVITDCYAINSSVLTGNKIAGGVAGCNYGGRVKNCYAYSCTISAHGSRGGLVVGDSCADGGDTDRPGYVDNCYAANCTYTASDSKSYSNIVSTQSVSDNVTKCEVLTAEQFASGEVAYLLNGESSDGVWGQNVASGKYPVIGGAAVYKVKSGLCSDTEEEMPTAYSNTNENIITHNEKAEINGICPNCGVYQAAVLTTDKYDIDGDNAYDSVYEISNAGQLYWFAEKVNSGNNEINGVLTDNITVNQNLLTELITVADDLTATVNGGKTVRNWTPMGGQYNVYYGTFDGRGFYVSGLYCNNSSVEYVGLFGNVDGTIKNLCVKDSYFCGYRYVGAVAGAGSTTEKCISDGNRVKGSFYIGGVCGYMTSGTLSDCFNSSTVKGITAVGGIVGKINKGINETDYPVVKNCLNVGAVSGNNRVGGVCGQADEAVVQNCYYLSTKASAGVGENYNSTATITNVEAKTAEQLTSGEVAYLLGSAWGQTLNTDELLPILGDDRVYKYIDTDGYSNELKLGYAEISSGTVKVNIPTAGEYTVVFVDNGEKIPNKIDTESFEVTDGTIGEITVTNDKGIILGTGDEVMLWGSLTNPAPKCETYVVD